MTLLDHLDPVLIVSALGSLILFALVFYLNQSVTEGKSRSEIKKRLALNPDNQPVNGENSAPGKETEKAAPSKITKKVASKANDYYSSTDPKSIKRLRMMLVQAGYMAPNAVGYFIAARFGMAALFGCAGAMIVLSTYADEGLGFKAGAIIAGIAVGYFLPNLYLGRKAASAEMANRQGFPDILDLMVVSAEAGLTMEASIERISKEIAVTYPILSMQLNMAAVEIRAGKPIDEALRAFGERLRLEEVKGFATMVQQAKELGTSITDALRVYSDEMRHKRMMKAEEKAYALPAKMSIPVTLFILPIVVGIAVIPTIVRWQ